MRHTILSVITVAVAVYSLLCLLLFVKQRSLLFFPQPRSPQPESSLLELHNGAERILVTAVERPGSRAILYFGGNAEDVSWNVPAFVRAFPVHSLYLLHYRGYGGSTGQPSEAGIVSDAFLLFDHVAARHTEIVLVGRSLGSGVAMQLAAARPARTLVLITPFDSIVGVGSALLPWLPVRWLMKDRFESHLYAPGITIPVHIIAAEHDEVIPGWSTEQLKTRFRPHQVTYSVIAEAGHNSISQKSDYWNTLQAAIER